MGKTKKKNAKRKKVRLGVTRKHKRWGGVGVVSNPMHANSDNSSISDNSNIQYNPLQAKVSNSSELNNPPLKRQDAVSSLTKNSPNAKNVTKIQPPIQNTELFPIIKDIVRNVISQQNKQTTKPKNVTNSQPPIQNKALSPSNGISQQTATKSQLPTKSSRPDMNKLISSIVNTVLKQHKIIKPSKTFIEQLKDIANSIVITIGDDKDRINLLSKFYKKKYKSYDNNGILQEREVLGNAKYHMTRTKSSGPNSAENALSELINGKSKNPAFETVYSIITDEKMPKPEILTNNSTP